MRRNATRRAENIGIGLLSWKFEFEFEFRRCDHQSIVAFGFGKGRKANGVREIFHEHHSSLSSLNMGSAIQRQRRWE